MYSSIQHSFRFGRLGEDYLSVALISCSRRSRCKIQNCQFWAKALYACRQGEALVAHPWSWSLSHTSSIGNSLWNTIKPSAQTQGVKLRGSRMGILFTKLFSNLFGDREARILVLGLDNAGKTTILYRLQVGEVVSTIPSKWYYKFPDLHLPQPNAA